jgi:hypothetical protein
MVRGRVLEHFLEGLRIPLRETPTHGALEQVALTAGPLPLDLDVVVSEAGDGDGLGDATGVNTVTALGPTIAHR